ncbi:MAG: hypothetical protein HFI34_05990 [Lachnospiraceae bacterium]|nr:hypothetical protein [Lachnospiraceae bacterium]
MKDSSLNFNKKIKNLYIYTPFVKSVLKDNLAYKGTFYLYILCKILCVFITYYLWRAIFLSSDNASLGGFTQIEMVTYIFMSFVCSNIVFISMTTKIGNDVMDGSIAINLIKPISYKLKLLSESFGEMIYKLIFPSLFIWGGVEFYKFYTLENYHFLISNALLFLISSFLGFIIYFLFEFCFGMLAFYSTYVWGMEIIKNSILTFLTGQLIPLTFFPDIIQKIFDYFPFALMNYGPVMIYLGKFNRSKIIFLIGKQMLWILLLEIFSYCLWKKITKRISILGG